MAYNYTLEYKRFAADLMEEHGMHSNVVRERLLETYPDIKPPAKQLLYKWGDTHYHENQMIAEGRRPHYRVKAEYNHYKTESQAEKSLEVGNKLGIIVSGDDRYIADHRYEWGEITEVISPTLCWIKHPRFPSIPWLVDITEEDVRVRMPRTNQRREADAG